MCNYGRSFSPGQPAKAVTHKDPCQIQYPIVNIAATQRRYILTYFDGGDQYSRQ